MQASDSNKKQHGSVKAAVCVKAAVSSDDAHVWSALLGACLYAFSPLIWLYSTHAEVQAKRHHRMRQPGDAG
jgi:hypothetical protein